MHIKGQQSLAVKIFRFNTVEDTILMLRIDFNSMRTMCVLQSEHRWLVKQATYKYLKQMSDFSYRCGTQVHNIIGGNIRV